MYLCMYVWYGMVWYVCMYVYKIVHNKSSNLFPTGSHQLLFQDAKSRLEANELPASQE